ncbi:MAG TPA: caspase family protein [Blastocatellia bacterium]|nr:caspase family protein [Blastocatellia bacterium]
MKLKFQTLAAVFAALALAASSRAQSDSGAAARGPETWAVVVGISKYLKVPGGRQLQFADRDAAMFAEAIKKGGVRPENVRLLTGPSATVASIKSAIGNWAARSAGESDTVLIFFSGHGVYEREFREAYLLGYDSDPEDLYASALSVSDINQALGRRVNSRQVLILADAVRRDFFDPDKDGASTAAAFTQAFSQLATARAGASAIIASGPGEFSREGQRWGGHGVFTKHLIDALAGGADRDGNGLIAADELFDFISARVSEDTSNKQHPWRSESALAQIILTHLERQPVAAAIAAGKSGSVIRRGESQPAASPKTDGANKPQPEPVSSQAATASTVAGRTERIVPPRVIAKETSSPKPGASINTKRDDGAGAEAAHPKEPVTAPKISPARPRPPATSEVRKADATRAAPAPQFEPGNNEVSTASAPPPKPVAAPPSPAPVREERNNVQPGAVESSITVSKPGTAPSPLILQLEAAITSGNLIEPKSASAWDLYQRLLSDQGAQAEAARLKPVLAEALALYGRSIVGGDVRADNIADKVDDFKRAGQALGRARSLTPENQEVVAYEKLSAAQALIALQFYDEAERALAQVQSARLACIENAMGLLYQGKLDMYRAERAFKRAAELDAKWATPHYNLALIYRSQQGDASISELEQAAALDPSNSIFLVTLGDEYFTRQQWQRAADAFRRAVALKPADDSLHTKLGHALYSQGLQEEANREYQKARELRGKP